MMNTSWNILETEFTIELISKETAPHFKDTHGRMYPVFQRKLSYVIAQRKTTQKTVLECRDGQWYGTELNLEDWVQYV